MDRMPRESVPTNALYVRLPLAEAHKLDRAAEALRAPKKELVAELVARYVDPDSPAGLEHLRELRGPRQVGAPRRVIVEDDGGGLAVGHHAFSEAEPPDVLTLAQAAALLRVEERVLLTLAEEGRLPARRIGAEWRFARSALIAWLSGSPAGESAAGG